MKFHCHYTKVTKDVTVWCKILWPNVGLTTLPLSCAVVMKSGSLNLLAASGPVQACAGIA